LSRKTLLLATLALLACLSAFADEAQALRIGTITIQPLDVFSPEEAARGWIYRGADILHVESRAALIRKFLLFREGDRFEPALLAESERNLRALSFLKSASVTPSEPRDGLVDVTVVTQDSWSLEAGGSAGSKGGTATYGFELSETNFLGRGRQLQILYDNGVDRRKQSLVYRDPAFLRPYWKSLFLYSHNSDGDERRIQIARPFYSFTTGHAFEALADDLTQRVTMYRDSYADAIFSVKHRELLLSYGKSIDASTLRAIRLTGGIDLLDDRFAPFGPANASLPDDRRFRYLFAQLEDVESDFLKVNFVNKDLRYEDINLGRQLLLRTAFSPGPGQATALLRASAADGRRLGDRSFVLPDISLESRLDGGPRNAIASANVRYVLKLATSYPQTFVSRLALRRGWNLDRDVQFFADGLNGLRGYHIHAFEGDKSVMLNVEHRLFLGRELLQLISPGVAMFVDAGDAEPRGRAITLSRLKADAGFGLRIGLARTPKNILRIDFAWPLLADARGRRGLMISASSSQAF
jgi:hypothetical protein